MKKHLTIAQRVYDVAETRGLPMAQVAIAWMLSKPVVTAPIIGANQDKSPGCCRRGPLARVIITPVKFQQLEEAYQPVRYSVIRNLLKLARFF